MPLYENAFIYKLKHTEDYDDLNIYIGSTTNFRGRKYGHKSSCNNEKQKEYDYKVYEYIRKNGGWNEWVMIPIEQYSCNSKKELEIKERYYIDLLRPTLNKHIPTRNQKEYYENNKDKVLKKHKEYYENNKEKINKQNKKWKEANKEKITEQAREYYENNKDKVLKKHKEYYENNKEKIKQYEREYYESNKEIINERAKEYYQHNKENGTTYKKYKPDKYQKEYKSIYNNKCEK